MLDGEERRQLDGDQLDECDLDPHRAGDSTVAAQIAASPKRRGVQPAAAELAGGAALDVRPRDRASVPSGSTANISAINGKLAIGRRLCRHAWRCSAEKA